MGFRLAAVKLDDPECFIDRHLLEKNSRACLSSAQVPLLPLAVILSAFHHRELFFLSRGGLRFERFNPGLQADLFGFNIGFLSLLGPEELLVGFEVMILLSSHPEVLHPTACLSSSANRMCLR